MARGFIIGDGFCNKVTIKFVNGRLHWLPYEDDNYRNKNGNRKVSVRDIVCLGLVGEKEKCEILGGPD